MEYTSLFAKRNEAELTGLLTAAELDPERTLCPFCGCGFLVPGTVAADRYGVCLACYEKAKASASREYYRVIAAHKEGEFRIRLYLSSVFTSLYLGLLPWCIYSPSFCRRQRGRCRYREAEQC